MFGNSENKWDTWISEISFNSTNSINNITSNKNAIKVFPNPVVDVLNIEFGVDDEENLTIDIANLEGKIIKNLYKDFVFAGLYNFSFNKANLEPGIYFIQIKLKDNIIKNEKIIIN